MSFEPALELLKVQQQISIVGGGVVGGASYRYRISDSGRTRAALFLESSHYVGVAPVPLAQYQAYMRAYRAVRAARGDAQPGSPGLLASGHQRSRARPARARDQRRAFDVRLRAAGKRQDGHLAGDPQPARRRHRDPARARDRRPDRSPLRSGQSRGVATERRREQPDDSPRRRSAMGSLPPADGHGGRRADAVARWS